jgi:hypothetical protein
MLHIAPKTGRVSPRRQEAVHRGNAKELVMKIISHVEITKTVAFTHLAKALALGGAAISAYLLWVRPWQLRWGATNEEVARVMPGDEVVPRPTFNATRAITIKATPGKIWPWLVQIGFGRAGWYSYDLLDNFGKASSEEILPALQHLSVGDFIPIGPVKDAGMWVESFDPNRWILWKNKAGDATWLWAIEPSAEAESRLVTRNRVLYRWLSPTMLFNLLVEFADLAMMRKCLLGIKRRAEATAELITAQKTGGLSTAKPVCLE